MSIEDQYDAWVRGLMGSARASTKREADAAAQSVEEMQRALDEMTAQSQKRRTAAGKAADAVGRAADATMENVRRMSSELTASLKKDGLLDNAPAPAPQKPAPAKKRGDFVGLADQVRTRVLGQDEFVGAVVKAFRRPFVMGVPDAARARSVMLLCGAEGTGRHYALRCVAEELAARGLISTARIETMDLSLYPGPAQEKLFLQDLYAALQSDAEILAFDHYEGCASAYLNMLATLAIDGTLALSSRYVLQRGILVDVGTALAPGAVGELQAGGKYFVFFSSKGPEALAERFGARFVDALSGDICRTAPLHARKPERHRRAGAERPGPEGARPVRAGPFRRRGGAGPPGCPLRPRQRRGRHPGIRRRRLPRHCRVCAGPRGTAARRHRHAADSGRRPPDGRSKRRRAL